LQTQIQEDEVAERVNRLLLVNRDEVVAPPIQRACEDRTFELPVALHIATALLFLGFVSVLSLAFRAPEMAVPFGIFVVFIAAFFTVPVLWVRMRPDENSSRSLIWRDFLRDGIVTQAGRSGGHETAVLVLILPFLILCWAIAVATIAAIV
jgi:hypothetical protein